MSADDTWALLERQDDNAGKLAPKPGFTNMGTMEYLPESSQVNLMTYAGGGWGGKMVISDEPRLLIFVDGTTINSMYALVR